MLAKKPLLVLIEGALTGKRKASPKTFDFLAPILEYVDVSYQLQRSQVNQVVRWKMA